MTEMMSIILDAVGFGIGLLIPFVLSWAHDELKRRKRARRRARREVTA